MVDVCVDSKAALWVDKTIIRIKNQLIIQTCLDANQKSVNARKYMVMWDIAFFSSLDLRTVSLSGVSSLNKLTEYW